MGKKFVSSMCMVCVLCAIHTHCAVHHGPGDAAHVITNMTHAGWRYAERHGIGLNPHLDLKPVERKHKVAGVEPRSFVALRTDKTAGLEEAANEKSVLRVTGTVVNESRDSGTDKSVSHGSVKDKLAATDIDDRLKIVSDKTGKNGIESRVTNTLKIDETVLHESAKSESRATFTEDSVQNVDDIVRLSSEPLRAETASLRRPRESANDADVEFFMRKVFDKFGDGETIGMDGFRQMMNALRLDETATALQPPAKETDAPKNGTNGTAGERCVNPETLFAAVSTPHGLDDAGFRQLCPSLVYRLTAATERERADGCLLLPELAALASPAPHTGDEESAESNRGKVWLYATLSIIAISLCGLLGVAVIPIMKNLFYQQMLQFFVALAVGTLCGDALLHLLPHAMMASNGHASESQHDHDHAGHAGHEHDHSAHDANMWKGLVATLGIIFLFFTEKCLSVVSEWRKHHQRKRKDPPRVRVMRDNDTALGNATVGEKLCKHKYSSYPYCYNEIAAEMTDDYHHKNGHHSTRDNHNHTAASPAAGDSRGVGPEEVALTETGAGKVPCVHDHHGDSACRNHVVADDVEKAVVDKGEETIGRDSLTVILREHEQAHHGHSHTHGHVHSPPESLSAVAWMVVMGDGLHNFTDGMAIGAAFGANIAGGFSTAVAVFCHELPHELGDFAVLLKAGMSAKQAVFYNVMSSILCLVGMVIGVSLGNWETATQWIFAAAAGMFLYIALVDMIPELSSSHSKPGGSLMLCALQVTGLLLGLGIMLVIAMHEETLKNVFTDKP